MIKATSENQEGLKYEDRQKIVIKTGCVDITILDEMGKEIYRSLSPTSLILVALKNKFNNLDGRYTKL